MEKIPRLIFHSPFYLSLYLSLSMIFKVVHVLVIYQYMYMCLDILISKFEIVK